MPKERNRRLNTSQHKPHKPVASGRGRIGKKGVPKNRRLPDITAPLLITS